MRKGRRSRRARALDEAALDDYEELEPPVVRPTVNEMRNFEHYIRKIEQQKLNKYGAIKIIPPADWSFSATFNREEVVKREGARMIQPLKQMVDGRRGAFKVNLADAKKRSVAEYYDLATKHERKYRPQLYREPVHHEDDGQESILMKGSFGNEGWIGNGFEYCVTQELSCTLYYRRNIKRWNLKGSFRPKQMMMTMATKKNKKTINLKDERPDHNQEPGELDEMTLFGIPHLDDIGFDRKFHVEGYGTCAYGSYTMSGEIVYDEAADTKTLWLTRTYNLGEEQKEPMNLQATIKRLEKRDLAILEDSFWGTMHSESDPPLYGADQAGTMFHGAHADGWNPTRLDTMLRVGMTDDSAGITSPYLYFGMWRSMFAWHTEDMELNSLSFNHCGDPKIWYVVVPEDASKFEQMMAFEFADEYNICKEFVRHKNIMISPANLRAAGIRYVRAVHYPGEFMMTFSRGYHGGFNLGFNAAEAVNFATPNWIPHGRKAKYCKCEKWTFRVDVDELCERVRELEPFRLPRTPILGDRVIQCFADESDPTYEIALLVRLKKGKHGAPFTSIPLFVGDQFAKEFAFDPSIDKWEWPTPEIVSTLKAFQFIRRRIKRKSDREVADEALRKRLKDEALNHPNHKWLMMVMNNVEIHNFSKCNS